jgi:hypothetical protein
LTWAVVSGAALAGVTVGVGTAAAFAGVMPKKATIAMATAKTVADLVTVERGIFMRYS